MLFIARCSMRYIYTHTHIKSDCCRFFSLIHHLLPSRKSNYAFIVMVPKQVLGEKYYREKNSYILLKTWVLFCQVSVCFALKPWKLLLGALLITMDARHVARSNMYPVVKGGTTYTLAYVKSHKSNMWLRVPLAYSISTESIKSEEPKNLQTIQ